MRKPLDESSVAQSLDGNRLMGSLRFPRDGFLIRVQRTRNSDDRRNAPISRFEVHEAVCRVISLPLGTKTDNCRLSRAGECREPNMKIAKAVFAGAAVILVTCSGAIAQQNLTGTISKIDEANGKIAIQRTQSGTVGANPGGAVEEFKVQDGLVFNAVQPGDKVVFTLGEPDGVKTITKLQKQ
jgi:Cu/Ag efflux protein CusF